MLRKLFSRRTQDVADGEPPSPDERVSGETRLPLHVLAEDAELSVSSGCLAILTAGEARRVRIDEVSSVFLHGGASLTAPSLALLADNGVPLILCSRNGYYRGQLVDLSSVGSRTRCAQYAAASDETRRLGIARGLVRGKISSAARLVARREGRRSAAARRLAKAAEAANAAHDLAELRGIEGAAARDWWAVFPTYLQARGALFEMRGRTRRPPQDAANALLSYLYAVVAGHTAVAALAAGLDPQVGFLHAERPGRPALALDLLEPLRHAVVDAAVLSAINNGEFKEAEFETPDGSGAVRLSEPVDVGRLPFWSGGSRHAYPTRERKRLGEGR